MTMNGRSCQLHKNLYAWSLISAVCLLAIPGAADAQTSANDRLVYGDHGYYYLEPDPGVIFPETIRSAGAYIGGTGQLLVCGNFPGNLLYNLEFSAVEERSVTQTDGSESWEVDFLLKRTIRHDLPNIAGDASPKVDCGQFGPDASNADIYTVSGIVEIFEVNDDFNGTYYFSMNSSLQNPSLFKLRQQDLIPLARKDQIEVSFSYENAISFQGQTSSFPLNQKPDQITVHLPSCAATESGVYNGEQISNKLKTVSGVTAENLAITYPTESGTVNVGLALADIGSYDIFFRCTTKSTTGDVTAEPLKHTVVITPALEDQ